MDVIEFGSFYNDETQKKEKIEWMVLDEDEETLFVVSKKILGVAPYDKEEKTWEESLMRRGLNTKFYDAAFNSFEKECIVTTKVELTDWNYYFEPTFDKIFLLSRDEVEKYFPELALQQFEDKEIFPCAWWLRNIVNSVGPGAILVREDGSYGSEGRYSVEGVRPAMRILKNYLDLLPPEAVPGQTSMFENED